ncbi:MAG: ABC transporter permease [Coprobacillus sp. CAG:235_29_27]|nr:MAG: ABC transporter permease [Coprobacillus sp. CAG:235_29_27]
MKTIKKYPLLFILSLFILLCISFFVAINTGTIKVSFIQLLKGLFVEYNKDVASIYQIRFPRVIVTMLVGCALALAGLLFQVVLKNPLADPGIIGISAGAQLVSLLVGIFLPDLYTIKPLLTCLGGLITFILVYSLSWKSGLKTTRIILVGVAIHYTLTAIISFIESISSSISSSVGSVILYTWNDVQLLMIYILPILDLLGLEDRTLLSLGINVNLYRFIISLLAVILCSVSVAIAGVLSFVGLLVPHLARLFVGNKHSYLIPTSGLLGALVLLIADTLGRVIIAPYEITPAILMAIIGGPLFIILLKRSSMHES